MATFRALATKIATLQAKARAMGLFANDRELLECSVCGLMENVATGGGLFTCRLESLDEDSGLRFKKLSRDRFRCPACGATVRQADYPVREHGYGVLEQCLQPRVTSPKN